MKVIPPINTTRPWIIQPTMLTSSTAAEPGPGEVAWVSGTTYAVGDVRILASTHRRYERLVAGAGTASPAADVANWLDVGPTNKWAMWDTLRNSATVVPSALTVSVTPGKRINAIALMAVQADHVLITMTVGGVEKYRYEASLILRRTATWTDYFFGEFSFQHSVVLFNLPPYSGAVVNVTLTGAGNVSCGAMVIGTAVDLGRIEYRPVIDSLNFSKVDRDAFGNATLVPRRAVPTSDQKLWLLKDNVNKVLATKEALDAVPAVWSGLDDRSSDGYFEPLLVLGIWKRFSVSLDYPLEALVTLQLEEI